MPAITEMDTTMPFVYNISPTTNSTPFPTTRPVSTVEIGLVVTVVSIFVIITTTGNLFTIIAFFKDKKIRVNMSNWYLVNLACADLLVGCILLPMDAVLFAYQGSEWLLGEIVCKCLLTVDFIATGCSVCAIILISLDRYRLVTKELHYKMFQTRKKVLLQCLPTWIAVTVVVVFLIWAYPHLVSTVFSQNMCDAEFLYHREMAIVYSIITCFVPLTLLLYLNAFVYINVYRRSRRKRGAQTHAAAQIEQDRSSVAGNTALTPQTVSYTNLSSLDGKQSTEAAATVGNRPKDRRHVKTAKTLAVIVGAYLVCWSPYNITLMVTTFHQNEISVPSAVWNVSLYLLWFNSTLNPFLYAMCNVRFRQNFKQMLCCACGRRRRYLEER
ncbi:octopamine receptor beta-2R-like [Ptychodera flava]|uniref:octopamine receptor beta-2R-like n=1 Tax=Ptychodera flava TaxID=63121 RepID=UPI00396A4194